MAWFSFALLVAVMFPNIGGILGGLITSKNISTWYKIIKKPGWRPPNWVFGPVWTYLYCSMGYASYRIWIELDSPDILSLDQLPPPLKLFFLQIILNWIWTPIFFGLKNLTLALIEIILLDGVVVMTGLTFWKIDAVAGILFIPYGIWLTLATLLTFFVWKHNPEWRSGNPEMTKKE